MLSQYAAGLAPTAPGWTTWALTPQPGALKHLKAVTPTPHGDIVFAYDNDGAPEMRIEVPAGTSGVLTLPEAFRRRLAEVRVDGRGVVAGVPITLAPGRHRAVLAGGADRILASR